MNACGAGGLGSLFFFFLFLSQHANLPYNFTGAPESETLEPARAEMDEIALERCNDKRCAEARAILGDCSALGVVA